MKHFPLLKILVGVLITAVCLDSFAADVKISGLPAASSQTGVEVLPEVQSGATVGATVNQLATYIRAGNAATATALAATPTQCSAGNVSTGVQASGNANCSSVNSLWTCAANRIVFDNVSGQIACSASFTWNDTTKVLTLGSTATDPIITSGSTTNGQLKLYTANALAHAPDISPLLDGRQSVLMAAWDGTSTTSDFAFLSGNHDFDFWSPGNDFVAFTVRNTVAGTIASGGVQGCNENFTCILWMTTSASYNGTNYGNYPAGETSLMDCALGCFFGGGGTAALFMDTTQNVVTNLLGTNTTTRTNGFLYVPKVAGVPTGVPAHLTGNYSTSLPIQYDSTDNRLYVYNGGWKNVADASSLTTTTGSGNAVLATSPTLTTPNLGTPTALILTNATGLPDGALSSNVPLKNAANAFTSASTNSFTGQVTVDKVNVSGATSFSCPTNGMYLVSSNVLGFCSNGAQRFRATSAGIQIDSGGLISAGTKFTASGCSLSATVGGATAGSFTSGTTGTCTVTITLPTAPNGWVCHADDLTTPANFIGQSGSTTTSCTVTGTTVTGDNMNFMAIAY